MTVKGIDLSRFQVTTPSLTGLSFAFVKASGGLVPDPAYVMHTKNLENAGLVDCAYHFGYGNTTPAAQVAAFLAAALDRVDEPDLFALDLESVKAPQESMSQAQAAEFIAGMHKAGRKCGLYGSLSGFPLHLGQDWNWVADWGTASPPAIPWTFWQYQGSPLDSDLFNGTLDQLHALAGWPTGGANTPGVDMLSFSLTSIGSARLVGTGHYCIPLDGSPLDGPWLDGTNWIIFGEATLEKPIPGGAVGADRSSILLVLPTNRHDGTLWPYAKPAALLRMDTDWPKSKSPDLTPFTQADRDASYAAGKAAGDIKHTVGLVIDGVPGPTVTV